MQNELLDATFFTDCIDEIHYVLPFVKIVDTKTAFHRNWDIDSLYYLLTNFRHKIRVIHELCTKATIYGFLAGTATIQIYLIIAPFLNNLSGRSHLEWIISSYLTYNWMLILCEIQKSPITSFVYVQNSMLVEHFRVQKRVLGQKSHEKPKIVIGDIDHWSYWYPFFKRID